MAITDVTIRLNADDDALVGAEGWGEYDATASTRELCNQIVATLRDQISAVWQTWEWLVR